MQCVFLCADLMFASRVLGAAKSLGVSLKIVPVATDLGRSLSDQCQLIIVDLMMPGLDLTQAVTSAQQQSPSARIVAFGPHVDEAALAAARSAGCDVLTRGQFQQNYMALLQSLKDQQPNAAE